PILYHLVMKNIKIHILSKNPKLTEHLDFICKEIKTTLKTFNPYFRIDGLDIVIQHASKKDDPMVSHDMFDTYSTYVYINTNNKNFKNKKKFTRQINKELFHPLFFTSLQQRSKGPNDLLEAIIQQGVKTYAEYTFLKE